MASSLHILAGLCREGAHMQRAGTWIRNCALVVGMLTAGQSVDAQQGSTGHKVVMRVVGVSCLELNNDGPIELTLRVPLDGAGEPIGESDSSKRLFYTVTAGAGQRKKIQVRLDGSVPSGAALRVEAVAMRAGIGRAAGGPITLAGSDKDLVAAIGAAPRAGRRPTGSHCATLSSPWTVRA